MKHVVATLALLVLTLGITAPCASGAAIPAVSGTVRDAQGTPQMGALVELLGPDATIVARAFTDDHGRYFLYSVVPGSYQLRASAAFLVPVVRANLRVRAGMRSVADLTMTALLQAGNWLPTERRTRGEPADDWQWTLRSTANRPLLRLADDHQSNSGPSDPGVSSSADRRTRVFSEGQVLLLAGDGSFGQGGRHQVITMDHAGVDGDVSVLRANVRDASTSTAGASFVVTAGMERQQFLGGSTRFLVSVESHPELQTAAGGGLQLLRTASTEKLVLGDTFIVDAGTLFTAERLLGTRFSSAPYVRVAFRPTPEVALEYRLATDRSLQRTEDLDEPTLQGEELSDAQGRPLLQKGLHQELAASDTSAKHVVSVAVYRDVVPVQSVQGGGLSPDQDLAGQPVITDPTTGTLRLAVAGFSSDGVRVAWTQTFSPAVTACIEGDFGKALEAGQGGLSLDTVTTSLHAHTAAAVSGSLHMQSKRSGTAVSVRYRWQPTQSLTQLDAYDARPGDAYLGLHLNQRLWSGRRLKGLSAVVEATNLLAQGYEPLLSPDGQTLFLAQVPRGVLGGLAFSF